MPQTKKAPFRNIEYELEEKLIKGLRQVFATDDDFRYNKDRQQTKVLITSEFPDKEVVGKVPHILITGISMQTQADSSFTNGYLADITYNNMLNGAQCHVNFIPYSLQILCLGEWDTSKDLGARVFEYIRFVAYEYFSVHLELNMSNISKSPTSPTKQYPEKVFQTSINVSGTLYWAGARTPSVLNNIDTPLTNINIKF